MKKNIGVVIVISFLMILVIEICLKLSGRQPAYYGNEKYLPVIKPASFFIKDSIFGWKLGTGKFDFYSGDSLFFSCNVDANGNRVINRNEDLHKPTEGNNQQNKIFIYGCSNTFGQSVSDTSNYPFLLQKMLPSYQICNRGVPGYSLVQMYLSLKQDVERGNKPSIAIMNYSTFLDVRTVLDRGWLNSFKWGLKKSLKNRVFTLNYPYAKLASNDSLIIDYLKWEDWVEDWPFRDKSAIVNLANTAYDNFDLQIHKSQYNKTVMQCLYAVIEYCRKNRIQIIFYGLDKQCDSVFQLLKPRGALTQLSSVDIDAPGYNCEPFDPKHPNAKAHKIYANEVLDLLVSNNLVSCEEK